MVMDGVQNMRRLLRVLRGCWWLCVSVIMCAPGRHCSQRQVMYMLLGC